MSEAKAGAGEEKKSSKKKVIIIIVAVLLLVAAGGGAAYYFLKKAPEQTQEEAGAKGKKGAKAKGKNAAKAKGEAKEEHAAEADAKKTHEGEGGDSGDDGPRVRVEMIYYDMGKPFIVSFPQGAGAKLVSVSAAVSVEDAATEAALKKHDPMIRNNLMMLLGSQKPEELKTREGKEQLRAAMLKVIVDILKKTIGTAHVEEVFFTSFVMQ